MSIVAPICRQIPCGENLLGNKSDSSDFMCSAAVVWFKPHKTYYIYIKTVYVAVVALSVTVQVVIVYIYVLFEDRSSPL